MKKILFAHNFKREGFSVLEGKFEMIYPEKSIFKKDEILDRIGDVEVFVPNFTFMTDKEIIDKAPKLELIANFGVGYNNIDVAYAASRNVVVTNTPNSVLEPTAELCFGLIVATARKIGFYNYQVRQPEGINWGLYDNMGMSVFGKTLGIVGMGRIGQAVARRAVASGMKIIYHNRTRLSPEIESRYDARYVSFDQLLSEADIVSINAPSTSETYHLISEAELKKMKNTAILINTARGSLVDEIALAKALASGEILAAGLDVYEHEPNIPESLLKQTHNTVLCPHVGTLTSESRLAMQQEVANNILNYYEGEPISRVN
ncbi:NAD(P)-dependent oxidoreductase [Dysgonomonas sp. 520]|uniref:NAD(P)-dependent oxidoreductase n=1 Tax=Dysgonomonas sp. 520 TaxID=2302931 RepID=UPI0013CF60CE|nr:NAD(P)-dependent oxidoreductase [Dysgonomonas sp. 520]NDW10504.1 dihydrofolate reductase [Dysgonomonas sp. 520]